MTKPNTADLIVVVDRSSSMSPHIAAQTKALKEMLDAQLKLPIETAVTLVQFDHAYEEILARRPLKEARQRCQFTTRGMTALHDAMGKAIIAEGERLAELPEEERPATVTMIVITDGEENSSREFHAAKVKEMVKHQQDKYGWTFLYLGANQDAVLVGSSLGISLDHSLSYTQTTASYTGMGEILGRAVTSSTIGGSYSFTPEDAKAVSQ